MKAFRSHIGTAQHPARTQMSTVQVKLSKRVVDQALAFKPDYDSNTAHLSRLIELAIDTRNTLGKPSSQREVLPSKKAVNKEEDVDFSLRAEEAHIDVAAIKSPPKRTKEIPGNLFPHEDLIRSFWKVKGGKKSDHAWTRQMNQLTKLQELYGDQVVIAQLEEGRAKGWDAIEVRKYEQFGLNKSNTHQQASTVDWAAVEAVGSMF